MRLALMCRMLCQDKIYVYEFFLGSILMKILQVLPDLKKNGGVEQGVIDLARQYPDTVWVASAGGPLAAQVPHHLALPLHSKNPLTIMCNASRLAHLIRQQDFDLVHVRSRAPAWSVMLACKQARIPWIATYHGLYNAHNAVKKYYNGIMTRGKTVIAISDWVAKHVAQIYPCASVTTIHEGIDTAHFTPQKDGTLRNAWRSQHGIREGQKVILLPGRLTRWKGQHVLLEAARLLDDTWEVVLLGDVQQSHYGDELRTMAQNLSLNVHLLPACVDMRLPYAGADVVVSCSTDPEAFGRITAEALAMERPFIGTNHGGTVELTNNGQWGQLVPVGDAHALAQALAKLQQNKGAAAYIQQHYDVQHMYRQTMALYESLSKKLS